VCAQVDGLFTWSFDLEERKRKMFEIKGKVNTAICYAKVVEQEAIDQIARMCDYEFTAGSRIRIMPDVHAGKGCTIGTTMTVHDKAVPNIVGVDIGCGMYTVCLGDQEIDLVKLDEAPMAYKSLEDIIDVIKESVDVIDILKPIYNFKAG
jgi:RNA-splicing ligase RtcB